MAHKLGSFKNSYYIAMLAVVAALLVVPTSAAETLFYAGYVQTDTIDVWVRHVLPVAVAIISFLLVKGLLKAFVAGLVSWAINFLIMGAFSFALLDCGGAVTAGVGLSQACSVAAVFAFKLAIAAVICFNLFLLRRMTVTKGLLLTVKRKP